MSVTRMELIKYGCVLVVGTMLGLVHCSEFVKYTVTEEGLPNAFIGNVAVDFNLTSDGRSLRFSFIQEKPYYSFFNISETTGELRTRGVLDREQVCEFTSECEITLEFVVTGTKVTFFQKFKVNVTIMDVNDNAPFFNKTSLNISISESVVIGTTVSIDGASDPDGAQFSIKSYQITTPGSPFSANFSRILDGSTNVQIIVNKLLDREKVDHYEIQLVAIDGGIPPKSGTLLLNITVTDTNDNFPLFTNSIYNVTVKEDIAINSIILQVSAKDLDIGNNGQISYSMATHQSQDIKELFTINATTGEIKTIGQLVYAPNHQYQIIVEASDAGAQPHTTQAFVYVNVQDVENNPPNIKLNLLSSSNYAKVSELASVGAVVALVVVSDDDVGWNGITNCSLISDVFALQKSEVDEYKVIVAKPLDRERVASHNVTFICQDAGTPPLNSSKSFGITVLDENDHTPQFTQSEYTVDMTENNNIGDIVVIVSATDMDFGKNAEIHYVLQTDAGPHFTIDRNEGIVHAMSRFDREDVERYTFHVLAVDSGDNPYTATATVSLTINDINDNKPIFTQAYYEFRIPENQPWDIEVGKVVAEDKDIGNNGLVTYTISENFEIIVPFRLDPNGVLRTKTGLDREVQSRYDFTVVATDQGSPSRLNSTVNVSVFVTDVNDNSPFIVTPEKSGLIVHVSLSSPVNTPVYLLTAHDIDDGPNQELIYKLEDRNDTFIFDINDRGQILVARELELNDINLYKLQVGVYDNGNPQNFAKTVLIMSVVASNATAGAQLDEGLHSQNLLIALTVVIVTAVLAATIVVTIFVIRRMDKRKRDFFGADSNSDGSVEAEVVPGLSLDGNKDFYSQSSNSVQLAPVISHLSLDGSTSKDYIYKPRVNTPTPSSTSDGEGTNENQVTESHDPRLSSHSVQSREKQWTNQNEVEPSSSEMYTQRKMAEDSHSQLSGDGDSGRGGSVSDGHSNMGISHDADDLRIMQLQNLMRHSGRRGPPLPPHKSPRDEEMCPQPKKPTVGPPHHTQDHTRHHQPVNVQKDKHPEGRSVNFADTDMFYAAQSDSVPKSNLQRYPSYSERNPSHSLNYSSSYSSPRGKSSPGIQMGLSSIASHYQPHPLKDAQFHPSSKHQSCDQSDNYNRIHNYHPEHKLRYPSNRMLDETMDSIATTGYDDEDNTTTSGSYTIDNNHAEDFVELNVAQLKDIFV